MKPTYGSCPYCEQDLEEGVCQHRVADLRDDSDGVDTATPLYFGWSEYWGKVHEDMIASMDNYYEALCVLCDEILKQREAEQVIRATKGWPRMEKAMLREAIKLVNLARRREDRETANVCLGALGPKMKDLFAEFVLHCGGRATNWEISGQAPGYPEWSGTNYWAADAHECIRCIIQQSRNATDRLRKLMLKP